MGFDIAVVKKVCPVSESAGEIVSYSTDSSTIKGEAIAIAWPKDYEQLKALIKLASREGFSLVPRGGGTSFVGGAVPKKAVVVDVSRLNKVKKLFLSEKAVTVQAGVILDKLNNSIAEYGLEFPVRPSSHSSCTLGGMIATNAAGMQHSGRRMKDWVRNITFLDGTGKVFTVDKNDAKRFIGTEGCCGVIVEATLNLVEKKEHSTDLFKFSDLNSALSKLQELKEDKSVAEIAYVNTLASELAGMGGQEHLLVKYSGGKKGVIDPAEADVLWHKYGNIYSVLVKAGYPRIEDPIFENGGVKRFVDWLAKQGIPCYGNIAAGSVHPHLKNINDVEKVAKIVAELKGQMVGEHGVGLLRRRYAPFATTHNVRELRAKYDPKSIMNRGKVI